jgi:hypothetical protein
MAIEDFYQSFTAQRPAASSTGWNGGQAYADAGSFTGFLQESGKSLTTVNGVPLEQQSFILFTPITSTLQRGDIITYQSVKYVIDTEGTGQGISGVLHHKEYGVSRWQ